MIFSLKINLLRSLLTMVLVFRRKFLERAWQDNDTTKLRLLMNNCSVEQLIEADLKRFFVKYFPASFKRALVERSLLELQYRQVCDKRLPEWRLNGKTAGFIFADALNIQRPELLISGARLADLVLQPNSVVKPASGAGSAGVYLIGRNLIQDVKHAQTISSFDELRVKMASDLKSGTVKSDAWNVEEFISTVTGEPARDIKFYSFYGKVVLVLEVRRIPKVGYCWWLSDGRPLNSSSNIDLTGKYSGKLFSGNGFKPAWLDLAERISCEIPTPFCRIDFLSTGGDLSLIHISQGIVR